MSTAARHQLLRLVAVRCLARESCVIKLVAVLHRPGLLLLLAYAVRVKERCSNMMKYEAKCVSLPKSNR